MEVWKKICLVLIFPAALCLMAAWGPGAKVAQNTVLAGTDAGGAAEPAARALVNNDLPLVSAAKGGTGTNNAGKIDNDTDIIINGGGIFSLNGQSLNATGSGDIATLENRQTFVGFKIMSPGRKWKTADQTVTNSTTFVNDSDFNFTLAGSRKYSFIGKIFVSSVATSGVKIDFNGGTATATNVIYNGTFYTATTLSSQNSAALAAALGVTSLVVQMDVSGTIEVNAGGSFILRFAQTTETGAAETVTLQRGSWIWLEEMP